MTAKSGRLDTEFRDAIDRDSDSADAQEEY